jgi:hypothetical protein
MGVNSEAMVAFHQAPTWLVVLAITSIVLGAAILLLLGWHVVRRSLYAILVGACVVLIAEGVTALAVATALGDWQAPATTALAEVHCRRTGPTRVELRFATLDSAGRRGPEEAQTIDSLPCEVAIERLHFHQGLERFGLLERLRLARVGTVRRPTSTPTWRALPQPLGLPIASAEAQQVAIPTEDDAPYRVVADDRGLRVEKLVR